MPMQDKGVVDTTSLEFQWWFMLWCCRSIDLCEFLAVKWGRLFELFLAFEIHHARTQVDFWINGLQLDMTLWE